VGIRPSLLEFVLGCGGIAARGFGLARGKSLYQLIMLNLVLQLLALPYRAPGARAPYQFMMAFTKFLFLARASHVGTVAVEYLPTLISAMSIAGHSEALVAHIVFQYILEDTQRLILAKNTL